MTTKFIPKCSNPLDPHKVRLVADYLSKFKPFLILTGAGVSTESGIPDYRSEGVGLYATSKNRPIQYQDFIGRADLRRRYWARNYVGWIRFSSALPNYSHFVIRNWQESGKISGLITQNVDSLHYKAGSSPVIELHGSTHRVRCLNCKFRTSRYAFQRYIASLNTGWSSVVETMAPDGDVQISVDDVAVFNTPKCPQCQGIIKPDVVFFGENVPQNLVDQSYNEVDKCKALLVIGSSLQTFSAFRFVREACNQKKPVILVNIGKTRADKICTVKIENRCSDVLAYVDSIFMSE